MNNLRYYLLNHLIGGELDRMNISHYRLEKFCANEEQPTEEEAYQIWLTINRVNIRHGWWFIPFENIFPD